MSIRRDYFKAKVDILAQAAATLLGLKGRGAVLEDAVKLEEAFRQAFGFDGRLALALPFEEFLKMACRDVKPSPELLAALAKHFSDWADVLEASGKADVAALARERAVSCRALSEPLK